MSGYRHGVFVSEAATELTTLSRQTAGITFVVGTAPISEAIDPAPVNESILCTTYNEAVSRFGYSTETGKYTLCEATDVLFGLYNVSPAVFVNVYDPAKHNRSVEREKHLVTSDHRVVLDGDVLLPDLKVESKSEEDGDEVWTEISVAAREYTPTRTILTLPDAYSMGAQVYVTYTYGDVTKVDEQDVAGAVDAVTGRSTGLELVNEVFARYGYTVGTIIAPGFSHIAEVGLKMAAKAELINQHFSALGLADLQAEGCNGYAQANTVKSLRGYSSPYLAVCYPLVKVGNKVHHLSTHVAGVMAKLCADNGDIPYYSPSNRELLISGLCNADGSSNYFGLEAANLLNGQGIVTATNFNGWKVWGNNTSAYPGSVDPKDRWIGTRMMFNFIRSALTVRFWSQVSMPIHRRNIESVLNSANIYLNGLVSMGALAGGQLVFNEDENSAADMIAGKLTFHCRIAPPPPAEDIEFVLQYDASYLTSALS